MKFQMLSRNDALLQEFVERSFEIVKVKLPIEYLRHAETWGIFDNDKLVGGYMLVHGEPMRCLNFFTKEQRESMAVFQKIRPSELLEVTGVWTSSELKNRRYISSRLWIHMTYRILKSGKPYVIYGYNKEQKNLEALYKRLNPIVLYDGLSGNQSKLETTTHKSVAVEIAPVNRIPYVIMKGAMSRITKSVVYASTRKTKKLPQPSVSEGKTRELAG